MGFYLLNLQFYATAAHHIVASAAYAEVSAVGSYLRDVVGGERSGAYSRSVYHKTAVGVETNVDTFKRFVPVACLFAAESAQSDVRERLGHAIRAPDGVRKLPQLGCHLAAYGSAANDEMLYLPEQRALLLHLQAVVHLQRNHCCEHRRFA